MQVIVDDQLSLLTRLGALEPPADVDLPLLTVYAFELRLAGALAVDRSTAGVLQRLLEMYGHRSLEVADLLSSTGVVRALNPIEYTVDVARARSELDCNLLAAEVVAAARSEDAVVRLAPSNAQGQLRKALIKASVAGAIWRFEPSRAGLAVVEEALAVQ